MILYGFGGHARVIADCLVSQGIPITAVFDDNLSAEKCAYFFFGTYKPSVQPDEKIILAVGDNATRKKMAGQVQHAPGKVWHSSALISPSASIGEGSVVMMQAVVQANVRIGRHSIINTGALIEHDCQIADFVHIAPGAILCGGVKVGEGTLVGAGAVLLPGIKVGRECRIGAGSVIIESVADGVCMAGNPGRRIK